MLKELAVRAAVKYVFALLAVGLLLFVPAGSLSYWNAWLYLAVLFVPMFGVLVYLLMKEPDLLEKRLKTKEREAAQKKYLLLSLIIFFAAFTVPGFDFRYGWSHVPSWLVMFSTAIVFFSYCMFVAALKQNRYASRVIEVQQKQKLIETGLYSVVRHPLYLAASIMYLFSPLVLGSFYGLIPMLFLPLLLAMRIKNEEDVLRRGLVGYEAYMAKVRWRLLPWVKSQSLCKIIEGHAASLYEIKSV